MKRGEKPPSAILCADLHLRDSVPRARTDDYWKAQGEKLTTLWKLQYKYNCPVYCAGDIFHKAKSNPVIESLAIDHLPEKFYGIPGQHDLPDHNIDNFDKSSLGVLFAASTKIVKNPFEEMFRIGEGVGLIHTFIQKLGDEQDKIIGGSSAKALLRKYPDLKLIVSGDNHKPFVYEYEGRLLVNPGSMMRMKADQIDHKPRVYLWYEESNTVEPVYFPIDDGVIDRIHLEREEKKDERIEAFVSHLNNDYTVGLDFKNNLEIFFRNNETKKAVQKQIWEAME